MAEVRGIPYLSADRPIVDPKTGKPATWFMQAMNDLILRTGGQAADKIAAAVSTAATAAAATAAVTAGASTGVVLDPVYPLSDQPSTLTQTIIVVAAHTRTEGGITTPMPAGATAAVDRGSTYYVYYTTPGDYLTTANAADISAPGVNLVGPYYAEPPALISQDTEFIRNNLGSY